MTCNWNKASVVASSFGIKLGEPEKVEKIPTQQAFSTSQYSTNQVDDIIIRSEYTVLDGVKGSPSGDSQMENPAESGVNTTYIPAGGGYPGRFVAYLTSRVYGPPTGVTAKAYPRLIDFAGTSLNMANASPQQVQNNVYEISGAAKEVITPGSTYNDELPSHVAFASVVSSFLGGGSTPLLNAFMHTEDVYQFDQGSANPNDARYTRIGYARSIASQHNFGRQFAKTNYSGNVNPIIRYFKDEQDIIMDGKLWGVGDPTVIEANDGYYYMIYTTRALIVYNPGAPDPYLNSNGKYGNKAGLSIARALKSSVDSGNYGNNSNPWKKFKQVTSNVMDSANWVEPGYGGAESILWNYIEDSNGYRTQEVKHAPKWRAFSKVSFNPFLAEETTDTALLICKGGWVVQEPHPKGIIIHTSNNLIDWGGENDYLIVMTDDSAPVSGDYYYYEYPTLIGRDVVLGDGYSAHTTEENYLYYQKDKITVGIGGIVDHDLVRRSLTILK